MYVTCDLLTWNACSGVMQTRKQVRKSGTSGAGWGDALRSWPALPVAAQEQSSSRKRPSARDESPGETEAVSPGASNKRRQQSGPGRTGA